MGNIEISTLSKYDIRTPEFVMKSAGISLKATLCQTLGYMLSQLILTIGLPDIIPIVQ